ncbi:hypothetical protein KIN20_020293 [Parelaphostrongylus tenuis]|uniref:Kinesin motor domain-containing protein n=1 Tax=Parelaphostrongylus tenuis TaxID=148309 RepID=A0AAD5MM82_PARTN|nr:hypothetical protein KIN20_020293 [Parelaphostrongylus tenuis]
MARAYKPQFEFKASFLEVYNEELYDLLAERNKLELKMSSGSTTIHGLRSYDIGNADDGALSQFILRISSILAFSSLSPIHRSKWSLNMSRVDLTAA